MLLPFDKETWIAIIIYGIFHCDKNYYDSKSNATSKSGLRFWKKQSASNVGYVRNIFRHWNDSSSWPELCEIFIYGIFIVLFDHSHCISGKSVLIHEWRREKISSRDYE